jgi:hypothetical protein
MRFSEIKVGQFYTEDWSGYGRYSFLKIGPNTAFGFDHQLTYSFREEQELSTAKICNIDMHKFRDLLRHENFFEIAPSGTKDSLDKIEQIIKHRKG